jgi:zinc-ribbon domain
MPAHSFDEDDRDAPQEMDLEWAEGQDDEVPCPNCGELIHEDSPRCPHCGQWVVAGSSERQGGSWGWMIVAALLIAVVLVVWNRL